MELTSRLTEMSVSIRVSSVRIFRVCHFALSGQGFESHNEDEEDDEV